MTMCDCTSCSFTDSYAIKGFAEWPRGSIKGIRASESEYRAHVAHAWAGVSKTIQFKPGQEAKYTSTNPAPGYTGPRLFIAPAPMPVWWYKWNAAAT